MIEFKLAKAEGHFESLQYMGGYFSEDKSLIQVMQDLVNDGGWQIHTFTEEWALMEREV